MSDELKPPTEETVTEDAPAKETIIEAPSEEDSGDDESISAEELKAEIWEIGTRFKNAGLKPFWRMARSYANNVLDAVDGLAGALEGNKRKKG